MTAPNPWPVPDAAIDAAGLKFFGARVWAGSDQADRDRATDAILACLPLLGIAELLREASFTIRVLRAELNANGIITPPESIDPVLRNLRDAAARMKGEA